MAAHGFNERRIADNGAGVCDRFATSVRRYFFYGPEKSLTNAGAMRLASGIVFYTQSAGRLHGYGIGNTR
jgi:hypothetical protein